jgi:translation initiation factor IF-3
MKQRFSININKNQFRKQQALINHNIRSKEVRLILESSQDIISTQEAISLAKQQESDLVCVSTKSNPPICKIMDYGKYLYEQKKKQKLADKKQREAIVDLKEIQFRPATGIGDIKVKTKKIQEILDGGDKVKLIMKLRGRENAMKDFCMEKFKEFLTFVENYDFDYRPSIQGNKILAILRKSVIIKNND